MGALTNYYVDPSIAGDSGAGTVGDPYGDTQHALNTVTRDATNGDQFNVKAGTDEIPTAILDFTSYGVPTGAVPFVLRGYTSVANDGGQGGIDGNNGNFSILSTTRVTIIDMHLHNTGTAALLGAVTGIYRCELNNCSGKVSSSSSLANFMGNHVYDISGADLVAATNNCWNYYDNTQTKKSIRIIDTGVVSATVMGNIIVVGAGTTVRCIDIGDDNTKIIGNSILGAASTATAIYFSVNRENVVCLNNLIEGFSGTGGIGIDGVSRSEGFSLFGHNAVYNCTTAYANAADVILEPASSNETLSASPFDKSGANTFANRLVYFSPADVEGVYGGAFGQN